MARTLSSQAAAAKMIRAELKAAFPTVTFKVTSKSFSMGDSVHIDWTNGPTAADVDAIVGKYEYGHFDGMDDSYHYSNRRDDIPQSKYVSTDRHYTDEARRAALAYVNRRWGWDLRFIERQYGTQTWIEIDPLSDAHMDNGRGWRSFEVGLELQKATLLCSCCTADTLPGDAFCPQCGVRLTCTICHEPLPTKPVPERRYAPAHIDCVLAHVA